jgi:hypothetical protein
MKGPNYFKPDISSIINQNRKEGDLWQPVLKHLF